VAENKYKGSCLCGAVQFEVSGAFETTDACHCNQCRKWTGHFLASAEVPRSSLSVNGSENISWHHSSEKVRRGFCSKCGSSLFFDPLNTQKHQWIGISLGSFDTPTETTLGQHIFVAEKGDYYEITDGLPQSEY